MNLFVYWRRLVFFVLPACGLIFSRAVVAAGLHFLAVGDTGSAEEQQRMVAAALARFAQSSATNKPVRFILFLGDNFYESGVSSVEDPQWQEKLEKMYDPARLPMPFIAVLGNHDWRNSKPDVEIEYSAAHPESRWKMDAHYFKRQFWADPAITNEAPLLDLFAIDTQAWNKSDAHVKAYKNPRLAQEQFDWLEKELSTSRARWKIVIAHHPLYSNGAHGHDAQLTDLRERLGPLFAKTKVDAFITGHDHDLERIEIPGQPEEFLITGAGGKLRRKEFNDYPSFFAAKPGFLSVNLTGTRLNGEFLDAEGNILDAFSRKPNTESSR